jgi:hypothetical protein
MVENQPIPVELDREVDGFRAPLVHGKPACMIFKFFVYVRKVGQKTVVIIPGLPERRATAN